MMRKSLLAVVLLALLAVALTGCYTKKTGATKVPGIADFKLPAFPGSGANAVEVFTEMHYQPSYRIQEGPRLLPPSDSVPVTGKEVIYNAEGYERLQVPGQIRQEYARDKAEKLFQVNCSVCHGAGAAGDGSLAALDPQSGKPRYLVRGALPPDLVGAGTAARGATDGQLFGWISFGSQVGFAMAMAGRKPPTVMPEFHKLLTPEERWALVVYLRDKQGLLAR